MFIAWWTNIKHSLEISCYASFSLFLCFYTFVCANGRMSDWEDDCIRQEPSLLETYTFTFPRNSDPLVKCFVLLSFLLDSCFVWFVFTVQSPLLKSGRSGNLLIIPYKHYTFQGPSLAQIDFEISCWQDTIIIILQRHNSVNIQVIDSSFLINKSSLKVLAETLFEISCWLSVEKKKKKKKKKGKTLLLLVRRKTYGSVYFHSSAHKISKSYLYAKCVEVCPAQ